MQNDYPHVIEIIYTYNYEYRVDYGLEGTKYFKTFPEVIEYLKTKIK